MSEASSDAVPAGDAQTAPVAEVVQTTAVEDAGLKTPESLLNDKPSDAAEDKPTEDKPVESTEPIKYEDFSLPEGVTLDAAKMEQFTKLASEAKMPQEVAQKFVDMYSNELKALSEAPIRAWNEMQTKWQDEVRNDPEIGGKNLDKNLAATKIGLKNLLGENADKFFEALNITGAGNNPDIIRGLFKAAASHAPASPVAGSPAGGTKSAGSTLYPTMAGLGNGHEG